MTPGQAAYEAYFGKDVIDIQWDLLPQPVKDRWERVGFALMRYGRFDMQIERELQAS